MLKIGQGVVIVNEIGGIHTPEAAIQLFEKRLVPIQLHRLQQIKNTDVLIKIANAIAMCNPDAVFINTGSEEDKQFIRDLAIKREEETKLPMENHTIHFDLKKEQGRIVDRTFYIVNEGEDISSLARIMMRADALLDIKEKMTDIMRGHTMMIGFYLRGPIGAPVSNPALEITSSAYVMHSAELLYRNAYSVFGREVERLRHFFTNIHSEGLNRPEDLVNARIYMDRSHQTTYAMYCTYAGNTLLMKKGNHRFVVDKAVYENRGKELSEHMFITGLKGPTNGVTWFAGAAPSGCGKTATAMAGDYFIGDDLAQMWIDDAGIVRAINPECGIFGIVEDINWEEDPMLMDILRKPVTEVIWSNVLIDEKGVPHWVGNGEEPPLKGINYQGQWERGMTDEKGKEIPISHPNSRVTLASSALPNYSQLADDPKGVEISVITYSGRDSDTMPPVRVALNPDHGVVIGASIVSAATATEVGKTGINREPWANAPFTAGSLGDYMTAQFEFFGSKKITETHRPIIAGLNYFLTHEARGGTSNQLLGEKRDVKVWLGWLERRFHGDVGAIRTPIGYIPKFEDLKQLFESEINKEYAQDLYLKQFSLYIDPIVARINLQIKAYSMESNVPNKFFEILRHQREGLFALKDAYGPIISPFDLEKTKDLSADEN